jgi:hypothetical protein
MSMKPPRSVRREARGRPVELVEDAAGEQQGERECVGLQGDRGGAHEP